MVLLWFFSRLLFLSFPLQFYKLTFLLLLLNLLLLFPILLLHSILPFLPSLQSFSSHSLFSSFPSFLLISPRYFTLYPWTLLNIVNFIFLFFWPMTFFLLYYFELLQYLSFAKPKPLPLSLVHLLLLLHLLLYLFVLLFALTAFSTV